MWIADEEDDDDCEASSSDGFDEVVSENLFGGKLSE